MVTEADLIRPQWPAPPTVHALQTTRFGGVSTGPYHALNLGNHVGDSAVHVAANRQRLSPYVPSEPVWMRQVHGTTVVDAAQASCVPEADAACARHPETVCAIMTADCLPVLLCDQDGTVVAAAHAGWRGLQAGVIERTVAAMQVPGDRLMAWLGPAIGPQAFEVGAEVHAAFTQQDHEAQAAFVATPQNKWLADIYALARLRLQRLGIQAIYGGEYCTATNPSRFFSYRRDGVTGRMASMIWLQPGK